ncbi:MAG: ATP synthase F1 subunit gamma [Chitinispirillaceae bacterium]|nr:ATP synthase F1 subunit gamma [Chitinispirillaceae bacterium]
MLSVREYQRKIVSLKNILKITETMKLISSVKLQKSLKKHEESKIVFDTLKRLCSNVNKIESLKNSFWFNGYETTNSVGYLLLTSDRGLCGKFNMNLVKILLNEIYKKKEKNKIILSSGKKGYHYLKRYSLAPEKNYDIIKSPPSSKDAETISKDIINYFINRECEEFWIVYAKPIHGFTITPVIEKILPIDISNTDKNKPADYIIEDNKNLLIEHLSKAIVNIRIYYALLENNIAEHSARVTAMDNASVNCKKMIEKYIQLRNRARQSLITTELNEIITVKEAIG